MGKEDLIRRDSQPENLFVCFNKKSLFQLSSRYHFKNRLIEEETYRIVSHAIDSLPPQSSKIIKMCLEGKQNKEIAEILGISVNSVKTLKYNALSTLKEVLKDHFYILIILLLGEKI